MALRRTRWLVVVIGVAVAVGVTAHGVLDWRWRHADFRQLFASRIRSETPKSQSVSTATDPDDDIVVEPLSRTARFVCGPVYTRDIATGAVTRHVYGMVMMKGVFRILVNEGFGPTTAYRPDAEQASSDFCDQARLSRPK